MLLISSQTKMYFQTKMYLVVPKKVKLVNLSKTNAIFPGNFFQTKYLNSYNKYNIPAIHSLLVPCTLLGT